MTTYIPDEIALSALALFKSMVQGEAPSDPYDYQADYDSWQELVEAVCKSYSTGYSEGGMDKARQYAKQTLYALQADFPNLALLMGIKDQDNVSEDDIETMMALQAPPLPAIPKDLEEEYEAPSLDGLAETVTGWLEEYAAFSRTISSRGYDSFHYGCGLFILSTIAMRRVSIPILDGKYTNLFIALASDSAQYAKTTTARIALKTLAEVGLSDLLLQGNMTPEMYLHLQSTRVDDKYDQMTDEEQSLEEARLKHAGRLSLWWEEGGGKIAKIMHANSPYTGWLDVLRQLADGADISHHTRSGGHYYIPGAYGALLLNMTPEDIRSISKGAGNPWPSGFFPRFIFLTPPESAWKLGKKTELGRYDIPKHLTEPLIAWHKRLGEVRDFSVVPREREGKTTRGYTVKRSFPSESECSFSNGAYTAYQRYDAQVRMLANTAGIIPTDLKSWYTRLPERMLQVAALLASLENSGHIELKYIAKAIQIAEIWRKEVHNFYSQVKNGSTSLAKEEEDDVLRVVSRMNERGEWPTPGNVAARIATMSASRANVVLQGLVQAGVLTSYTYKGGKGKTLDVTVFGFPDSDPPAKYLAYLAEKEPENKKNGHKKTTVVTVS